jgi:hypothetical protein
MIMAVAAEPAMANFFAAILIVMMIIIYRRMKAGHSGTTPPSPEGDNLCQY